MSEKKSNGTMFKLYVMVLSWKIRIWNTIHEIITGEAQKRFDIAIRNFDTVLNEIINSKDPNKPDSLNPTFKKKQA